MSDLRKYLQEEEVAMFRQLTLEEMKAEADAAAEAYEITNRRAKWSAVIFGVIIVVLLAAISCLYLGVFI